MNGAAGPAQVAIWSESGQKGFVGALAYHFCLWLQNSPVGQFMQNWVYPFPMIQTVHIVGIVILAGSVTILDLRLMGVMLKGERVSRIRGVVLPWAWTGFAIQVVTGFFLFATEPLKLYTSVPFDLKMCMIVLVGVNALLFQTLVYRDVKSWDTAADPPFGAKLTGFLSLLLWLGIITAGRWIAYY